jgi:hypothetical protein
MRIVSGMPRADNPNTAPANEARRRIGDQRAADRLTRRGWAVLPPDAEHDPDLMALLAVAFESDDGSGCEDNCAGDEGGEDEASFCSVCLARVAIRTLLAGRAL